MQLVLIAAQSLDGFITRHDQPGAGFTSPEDKVWFGRALQDFDASILGGATYRAEHTLFLASRKPGRRRLVMTRQPAAYAADAVPGVLEFTAEAPAALVESLVGAGHRRCALLGGAQIHRQFLEAGLVDELWITLEPRLFGSGTPLVGGNVDISLKLLSTESLGGDSQLVRYAVRR
ncbi:MAG TPA: dihydrofolate reductase family protein [Opitutaceae bacterium]